MRNGPDIAAVAALIGDPARATMLSALLSGRAYTVSELAAEAGVALSTASGHLARLTAADLTVVRTQGRHRYYALASPDVAAALEALSVLSAGTHQKRTRPGPRDPALRAARRCYDHLAGAAGVQLYDSLSARGFLQSGPSGLRLTPEGADFIATLGIDERAIAVGAAPKGRKRPFARPCLDWSERRDHLAGWLGAALLARMQELDWVRRDPDSRAMIFSATGRQAFDRAFPPVDARIDVRVDARVKA